MDRRTAGLKKLSGILVPDREMENVCHKEFFEASKKEPPFAPFVVPKFQDKHWLVPLQSRDRAAKYWRETVDRKARDPSHQVSLQAWILYLVRFIFTGDLCNDWDMFGGLSSQLSHLSIGLHLCITENAPRAISYD